jgi:hypothetical protein
MIKIKIIHICLIHYLRSQMAVQIKDDGTAIILPRVVVAGTVTRRAVEPTWLTASNAQVKINIHFLNQISLCSA